MAKFASIIGHDGPLKDEISQRLNDSFPVSVRHRSEPVEIGLGVEASSLSIFDWRNPIPTKSPSILLRDVVTSIDDPVWSNGDFHNLIANVVNGNEYRYQYSEPRFWLPADYVANSIRTMVMSGRLSSIERPILMSGRRPWSDKSLFREVEHLWSRFQASRDGSHTVSTLSEPPLQSAPREADTVLRPDLADIDSLMRSCGEPDGWRPSGSLRLTIMRVLATIE